MAKNIAIIFFFLSTVLLNAQVDLRVGKVSSTSSQLVYVSFDNTDSISKDDTLFIKTKDKLIAALKVKYISSSSAACEKLKNDEFKTGVIVYAVIKSKLIPVVESATVIAPAVTNNIQQVEQINTANIQRVKTIESEIKGRYSLQSYSNFNNLNGRGDYQRWRHSLRFGARNIGGSNLSFSTYAIFAYKADEWYLVSDNIGKALKVYDLNINFQFDETARIWAGRYLNPKISNISIVDGVQFEKSFSFLTFGLLAGSRPNYADFGFNAKLFEYGFYLNKKDTIGSGYMENTFSIFEQTNDSKTDRRFFYFQHSNNAIANVYLFASTEVDLYKKELGVSKSDFSFTSLYLSARYAPVREFSLSLSYDARKNVYYYETYKSISETILENETRQGLRARATIRPMNNITVGVQYGYRYSKSDVKASTNYGGNISYTMIPLIESSFTLNYNHLTSSYVDGNIYSFDLSKSVYLIQSDISIGFRQTNYTFSNYSSKLDEKAVLLNFSTSAFNPFSFSISYEGVFESSRSYGRILFDLSTRF